MKQDTNTNSPVIPFFKGDEDKRESACEQRALVLGFTLVELIVVITILAVLGTIAFLSFQSYTVYARDVVRLSNLKNLESGLQIQYTQGGNYAVPDHYVNITASGTIIRQQGVFGTNALRTIKANKDASKDPLTEQYYDYVTDAYQSEYQLVGYMESDEAMNVGYESIRTLQGTHASGTGFIMKTLGQDMGIVSTGGVDLHRTDSNIGQSFDIRNNAGVEYRIVFDETDEIISSSGSELFSNVYNRSKNLLKNKELAKLDDSLVLYFDMETTTMSGGLVFMKDLSMYNNDGECYTFNSGVAFNCDKLILEEVNSFYSKGMVSSLGGATIRVNDQQSLDISKELTLALVMGVSSLPANVYRPLTKWTNTGDANYVIYYFGDLYGVNSSQFSMFGNAGGGWVSLSFPYTNIVHPNSVKSLSYTYDSLNGGKSFVDGLEFSSNSVLGELAVNDRQLKIGNFDGYIDEVRIYNRALSEKEIKIIYGSTIN